MKALNIIESAYRATIEEQDDTIVWLTHAMKAADADLAVLLRGNAVNYAVRLQDAAGLAFGDWWQTQPPRPADDIAALSARGITVYCWPRTSPSAVSTREIWFPGWSALFATVFPRSSLLTIRSGIGSHTQREIRAPRRMNPGRGNSGRSGNWRRDKGGDYGLHQRSAGNGGRTAHYQFSYDETFSASDGWVRHCQINGSRNESAQHSFTWRFPEPAFLSNFPPTGQMKVARSVAV
jgi:hypothetical protein